MIVQCDSGHLNSDLIACARYRVCDEAIRAKTKNKIHGGDNIDFTRILFVIHLPQQEVKSQFVGFQGDPWISVHIDDLRATSEITVIPEQALNASISELFIGRLTEKNQERPALEEINDSGSYFGIETGEEDSEDESTPRPHPVAEVPTQDSFEEEVPCQEDKLWAERSGSFHPQHHRLLGCVQAAVSMLKDTMKDRAKHRILKLMSLIPKTHTEELGKLYTCLYM